MVKIPPFNIGGVGSVSREGLRFHFVPKNLKK